MCFDLDGTLVDSTADIRDGLRAALAAVPPATAADEEVLKLAGFGIPLEEFFTRARTKGHPHAGPVGAERFIAGYRAHYDAHLLDRTRPFAGVVAMLERVRAIPGVVTAVATTKRNTTARRVVDGLGLAPFFDLVRGSDGLRPKPAPDVLLAISGELAVDLRGAVLVGDTVRDVEAARAAGVTSIGVAWGETGVDLLRAAGASAIAHTPDEVVSLILG